MLLELSEKQDSPIMTGRSLNYAFAACHTRRNTTLAHITICLFVFYHFSPLRSNVSLAATSVCLQACAQTHTVAADLPRELNKSAFYQVRSCPESADMGHTTRFQMSRMLNKALRFLSELTQGSFGNEKGGWCE